MNKENRAFAYKTVIENYVILLIRHALKAKVENTSFKTSIIL